MEANFITLLYIKSSSTEADKKIAHVVPYQPASRLASTSKFHTLPNIVITIEE